MLKQKCNKNCKAEDCECANSLAEFIDRTEVWNKAIEQAARIADTRSRIGKAILELKK